jgi:DNA-binding Lrp family transcriptional regulator
MDLPYEISDPVNARILAVSEDKLQGFQREPLQQIARLTGLEAAVVMERIRAMLRAGTIRRVRQTLLATNLAQGALVAWQVPLEKLDAAFYKLWTTLKVPQGFSMEEHCQFLARQTGAEHFRLMPAKRLFALGVGHIRRRGLEPGAKADAPAEVTEVAVVKLNEIEWRILTALKREFEAEEIVEDLWRARAAEANVPLDVFCETAADFDRRKIIGRFSTFLEHVKPLKDGDRVTRFNALFHWAVPPGREIETGREVGRHYIMTHAYWREGGPEFHDVNIMGVAHGMEKPLVLAHKEAIDRHLAACGIPVSYTNVFWGGRSEIKPSEIAPAAYRNWRRKMGWFTE